MKKNLARSLAVAGAAAALGIGMTTSAFAGPPWTVSVAGSTTAGNHAFVGNTTAAIAFHAGVNMTCGSVTVGSSNVSTDFVTSGAPISGDKIAEFQTSSWNACKGPLNIDMEVIQHGAWEVHATSGPDANNDVQGSVTNIWATVQDKSSHGGVCQFDVTGSAPGVFHNGTQILDVNATSLTVSAVSGCFSLVSGPASFSGSFDITDPSGVHFPIAIS